MKKNKNKEHLSSSSNKLERCFMSSQCKRNKLHVYCSACLELLSNMLRRNIRRRWAKSAEMERERERGGEVKERKRRVKAREKVERTRREKHEALSLIKRARVNGILKEQRNNKIAAANTASASHTTTKAPTSKDKQTKKWRKKCKPQASHAFYSTHRHQTRIIPSDNCNILCAHILKLDEAKRRKINDATLFVADRLMCAWSVYVHARYYIHQQFENDSGIVKLKSKICLSQTAVLLWKSFYSYFALIKFAQLGIWFCLSNRNMMKLLYWDAATTVSVCHSFTFSFSPDLFEFTAFVLFPYTWYAPK